MDLCSIDDCTVKRYCRGWCRKHYSRWFRHGDPTFVEIIHNDDEARFRASYVVDVVTGCHLWTRDLNHRGYAKFFSQGHSTSGHIWAWVQKNGPVPTGLQLDHFFCDTKRCVNADHVRPVTPRENVLRSNNPAALNAAKTHCINNHEFTPENTRIIHNGARMCRECGRQSVRAYRARKKATS